MTVDESIQDMVGKELRWDKSVNAAHVGVSVTQGVVTLQGHVDTYPEKQRAEKAALRVRGVRSVANDLVVHVPRDGTRDDTDIALGITQAMTKNVNIPRGAVQSTVRNGWVVLDGKIDWEYQRLAAEKVARDVPGVAGLTNSIRLEQHASPQNVEREITAALHRLADIDAHDVQVRIVESVAVLTGRVSSWQEVNAARRAAADAPGVSRVDVKLHVEPAPTAAGV